MTTKYLDDNGLLYLWQKIRTTFVSDVAWDSTSKKLVKKKKTGTSGAEQSTDLVTFSTVATSGSYNDLSDKPTIPSGVEKTTTTPKMDGTAAIGSEVKFAAGDHVHPTDTSRAPTSHASSATTYGKGTTSNYGHVKLSDSTSSTTAAESGGTAATPKAVKDALDAAKTYADGIDIGVSDVTVGGTSVVSSHVAALGAAAGKSVISSISSDSNDLPTVTAVKGYVATAITGAAAFQGTAPTTFAPTNYKKGWYWVVGTAGTYCGQSCEVGDMIFCTEDYSSAYSASDFDVVQTNLDIATITNAEIDTIVAS